MARFFWRGKELEFSDGAPLAVALYSARVPHVSYSAHGDPLQVFSNEWWVTDVVVRVEGVGDVPLPLVKVREGLKACPAESVEEGAAYKASKVEDVECDVLVVGGGFSGLSAALAAHEAGARVVLVEGCEELGGFYARLSRYKHVVRELAKSVEESVKVLKSTVYDGLLEDCAVAHKLSIGDGALYRIKFKAIVLATGAIDAYPLFPGNNLVGVISASFALELLRYGVHPGKRGAVIGYDPTSKLVLEEVREAGCEVKFIDVNKEGIAEASGEDGWVRSIKLVSWGESEVADVDFVVSAIRYPFIDAALQAGVRYVYRPDMGGFVPVHRDDGSTNVPGVFVAGDCGGLLPPELHKFSGRVAGLAAAAHAGYKADVSKALEEFRSALKEHGAVYDVCEGDSFRGSVARAWLSKDVDDSLVCRCMGVKLKEVIDEIERLGSYTMEHVKRVKCVGIGRCQGKLCVYTLSEVIASVKGVSAGEVGIPRRRFPLYPIPVGIIG